MAKAGVLLDLPGDKAKVLGTWVDLEMTSGGHYALFIMPVEKDLKKVEKWLGNLPKSMKEKEGVMLKLHRQLGHPRKEVWETLLKKVKGWNKKMMNMVGKIHDRCKGCTLKKDEHDKNMMQEEKSEQVIEKGIELRRLYQKQVQEEQEAQPNIQQEQEEQARLNEQKEQAAQQQGQLALAPEKADNQDQGAREPQQQRKQVNRSETAPADGRTTAATSRKPTNYPRAGDHIQFKEGENWLKAEVMGRGGKASSKLHFDYFNLRSRGEEEEKQCGVHLDRTEWRFDDAGKDLQVEDENVVEQALFTNPGKKGCMGHHPLTGVPMLLPTFDT